MLVPFRTASAHPFSYPFRSMRDIRNALSLRFEPLISGEEALEIVPWVKTTGKRGATGAAWCIAAGEIPDDSEIGGGNVVWPLPLALAGAVDGEGIAVYRGDGILASAVFSGGSPLFCRSSVAGSGPGEADMDREVRLCRELAAASGLEDLSSSVWRGDSVAELHDAARETVDRFPSFLSVNIQRSALDTSLARERTAVALRNFSAAAAVAGLCFCGVQLWLAGQVRSSLSDLTSRSRAIYSEIAAPGERIVDPLSQIRGKLAAAAGNGRDELTLSSVLSHLARAWMSEEGGRRPEYPVLELLRYSGEGAELTGTASAMEAIRALRAAADEPPFRASLGDVQQIPGGGLRFSLSLRRRDP